MLFFLTISLSSVCRMDGQVLRSICDQFRSSSRSYFVKDLILEDTISLDTISHQHNNCTFFR